MAQSFEFPPFAQPAPDIGPGVCRLTDGPLAHGHHYHKYQPLSDDRNAVLLLRYNLNEAVAEVGLLGLASGKFKTLARTTAWCTHDLARQMWVGEDVLFHQEWNADGELVYVLADRRGQTRAFSAPVRQLEAVRDGVAYGASSNRRSFPGLRIADPRTVGIDAVDLTSGTTRLRCSHARLFDACPPDPPLGSTRVAVKQLHLHADQKHLLFVLTNWPAKRMGFDADQPAVKHLFALNLDTDHLQRIGAIGHHPMWHPTELSAVHFTPDESGEWRVALDQIPASGEIRRRFLPYFSKTGHPSVSPDGTRVLTDNYSRSPGEVVLDIHDLATGETREIARYRDGAGALDYPTWTLERGAEESIPDFDQRVTQLVPKPLNVQAHPVWDPTGRYVFFNANPDGVSQFYCADTQAF